MQFALKSQILKHVRSFCLVFISFLLVPFAFGKEYKIGLVMLGMNAPYYRGMVVGFEDEVKKRGSVAYSSDAQWKLDKQIADFEDMLTKGVDGIIINAIDPKAMVPSIAGAVESGIPVIAIDSGMSPEAPLVTHIQSDSPNNGQMLGAWLVDEMGDKQIKLVIMSGSKGSEEGKRRRLNLISGIAESLMKSNNKGKIEIVTQAWGGWNQNDGLKAMEDVLVAHAGGFNVVFSENDSMGMGARQAVIEAGTKSDVVYISVDGQKECYELIKDGKYNATTVNNPDKIARTAVDYMFKYLAGERNIPQKIYTPPMVITKGNVGDVYDPKSVF
ncbi:MAG: substrate-binding domain-containing protein [SAR324 cluster bacterium]|nr:substrate-binding domain-containing protein [SAR324 cluster bacterium]